MKTLDAIETSFRAARSAKDRFGMETFNMLRAALKNALIEKGEPLNNEEVLVLLRREVKQYEEALVSLEESGAEERAEDAEKRLDLLRPLLPKAMEEEEVFAVIDGVISSMESPSLGPVMGQVMGKLKGKGVDGGKVKGWVASRLARD
ncbi:GatB/YqeY domain-containing protein [bacterium]|nr:GatB/YqeY domain-containing protein [bacterium]